MYEVKEVLSEFTWFELFILTIFGLLIIYEILKYLINFKKNINKLSKKISRLKKYSETFIRSIGNFRRKSTQVSLNYFKNFGWIAIIVIILLIIIPVFTGFQFHWILLIFILIVFLFSPMRFIYTLVGGSNSLRVFFLLFILTQLLFSGIYSTYLNKCYIFYPKDEPSTLVFLDKQQEKDPFFKITYKQILLNTFYTALVQESGPLFNKIIEKESKGEHYEKIFVIVNIQIFISWIYLGVLIASLYNKITNR